MAEKKKKQEGQPYSLEELNKQFNTKQIGSNVKKKKNKAIIKILPVLLIAVVLVVALIIWKIMSGNQSAGGSSEDATTVESSTIDIVSDSEPGTFNESILSDEEQEKWASTDQYDDKIYVDLNSNIYLDGRKAYIRLINPIYSVYYYSITIYPESDEDTILYQSEKIAPGTILEAVMLTAEPTEDQYYAIVKYMVYDDEGNEMGTHTAHVEFTTDEQYK